MRTCVLAALAEHVAASIPLSETDEAVAANIVEIEETALVLRAKSKEGALFQLATLHADIDDIAARVGENSPEADFVMAKSKAIHRALNPIISVLSEGSIDPVKTCLLDFYGVEARSARQ